MDDLPSPKRSRLGFAQAGAAALRPEPFSKPAITPPRRA